MVYQLNVKKPAIVGYSPLQFSIALHTYASQEVKFLNLFPSFMTLTDKICQEKYFPSQGKQHTTVATKTKS
jgi:hypothetical protein